LCSIFTLAIEASIVSKTKRKRKKEKKRRTYINVEFRIVLHLIMIQVNILDFISTLNHTDSIKCHIAQCWLVANYSKQYTYFIVYKWSISSVAKKIDVNGCKWFHKWLQMEKPNDCKLL
jgi:hypothetical protein